MQYTEILKFWFEELQPQDHFKKNDALDEQIKQRFLDIHTKASNSELNDWRKSADSSLAEILLLDQFSRNIYRNSPKAFAQDPLAVALAQVAIEKGFDQQIPKEKRSFFYMPFMHSESLAVHKQALQLFSVPGFEGILDYEIKHKNIIEKFGRYPHRNEVLGRPSTEEEKRFLTQPGSSF